MANKKTMYRRKRAFCQTKDDHIWKLCTQKERAQMEKNDSKSFPKYEFKEIEPSAPHPEAKVKQDAKKQESKDKK